MTHLASTLVSSDPDSWRDDDPYWYTDLPDPEPETDLQWAVRLRQTRRGLRQFTPAYIIDLRRGDQINDSGDFICGLYGCHHHVHKLYAMCDECSTRRPAKWQLPKVKCLLCTSLVTVGDDLCDDCLVRLDRWEFPPLEYIEKDGYRSYGDEHGGRGNMSTRWRR